MENLYHLSHRPEILPDKFGFLIHLICLKEGLKNSLKCVYKRKNNEMELN